MTSQLYETGLAIRKEVVGAEYVERALATAGDFGDPLQELVTEFCWGAVWGREGLDRKTRSLLNLAMLAALNRSEELRTHIQGARRNGATLVEIRETLLQVAVYAGVPAGIEAFRVARDALALDERDEVG